MMVQVVSFSFIFSRSYYVGVTLKDCDLDEEVPEEGSDESIMITGTVISCGTP